MARSRRIELLLNDRQSLVLPLNYDRMYSRMDSNHCLGLRRSSLCPLNYSSEHCTGIEPVCSRFANDCVTSSPTMYVVLVTGFAPMLIASKATVLSTKLYKSSCCVNRIRTCDFHLMRVVGWPLPYSAILYPNQGLGDTRPSMCKHTDFRTPPLSMKEVLMYYIVGIF